MSKHTPASILDAADAELGPSCCDEDYQRLRSVMEVAPDLLEALTKLLEFWQPSGSPEEHDIQAEGHAAIARAKGESQ